MTEPILTPQEFYLIWDQSTDECEDLHESIAAYTTAIEAAVLEKVCGEPVAWQWRKSDKPWSLDLTFNTEVFATMDRTEVRALYALTRSKL